MVGDDRDAHDHRLPLLHQLTDEHQVAHRLRHLLAVHAHHRLVHPVPHEQLPGRGLRLGGLALVVREDQVGAAAVQVDGRAELAQGERGALDVPARAARSPQRLPRGLARRRRLPEHEVERIALVGVVGPSPALGGQREHLITVVVTDLTEALERAHAEVHGPPRLVRVATVEHHADEAEDVVDGRRGARLAEARQRVEDAHVRVEAGHLLGGQVEVVDAELARLAQDVVVDVGDVADALRFVAEVAQAPLQDVVGDVHRGVAEVRRVVRSDTARVHRDHGPRLEGDDLAPRRVVEPHAHGLRRRCR